MFTEKLAQENLIDLLTAPGTYQPFPPAQKREAWQNLPAAIRQDAIAQAEAFSGQNWPSLNATDFLAFSRSGNRLAFEKPHFARRRALTALVLGECMEGRGRFLDDIINGLWHVCEETFWGVSAHNGNAPEEALPDAENPYIDLFAAETGGLLALTDALLGDAFDKVTPLLRRRLKIELKRRLIDPFLHRLDFWWMGYIRQDLNNWTPWILANLLTVFLLQESDVFRRRRGIEKMFVSMDRYLETYHDDGGCDEGTSYWNVAGGALFDFIDQLDGASGGKISFWDEKLVQNLGRFMYRLHIDGDYFVNYADGAARIAINRNLLYRYGQRIEDEKLMRLAQNLPDSGRPAVRVEPLRRLLPQLFEPMPPRDDKAGFPYVRDVYLDGIQVMAAREKEGSACGLFLAAKGGHNFESHNHNDVGSCVVFVDGKPGLIDVGVETYTKKTFSDRRYEIWTMQSQYHNLPTLNGHMQQAGLEFKADQVVYENKADQVCLGLNLESAYPAAAKVKTYRRTYTFWRDKKASIEIGDDYAFSSNQNEIVFNFMTWKKPRPVAPGHVVIELDSQTSLSLEFDPDGTKVDIEACATRDEKLGPVWGEGGVYRLALSRSVGASGSYRVRLSAKDGSGDQGA